MTDADDELEAIRERKLERLKGQSSDGVGRGPNGDDGGTDRGVGDAAPAEPIHVESADHFASLVDRHPVVLVDFYADWCGPCKMLEPIVDDLAAETDAAVLKVDIDAHQGLARNHQVQGVPTLLVYADGEPVDRVVGVAEKHELASLIDAAG